ncbi:dihydrolipoyl dehydrogenase [Desulfofundulus sp.]|uniref:dihydrolipoyl dehydrogenase n=1 Tax=Desulfofundulus sp. TaxID=2282750 RepID=UPI003C74988B
MEARLVQVDVAVLGGGPAGYVAAIEASRLGASVALVEEKDIGGTCLNRGCIPTKALLKTAEMARSLKKAGEFGFELKPAGVCWEVAQARKERIVKNLRMGLEHLLDKNNIQVFRGYGEIRSANQIFVKNGGTENILSCQKMIIATGSAPAIPDIPGISLPNVLTSDEALNLKEVPRDILIMGAGAIGLEFATMFKAVGAKVTVVEVRENILPQEDKEITTELLKIMKRQGISFRLCARVCEIKEDGEGLEVVIEEKGKELSLKTGMVLVAIGRKLRINSSDVAALGVKIENGAILVNDKMETSVKGVYAAGDVVGGKLLAHVAFSEGKVAARNALGWESRVNYLTVPSCVYTNPEVASVGLNEEQCKSQGIQFNVGRFNFRNNGMALCMGERDGFAKIIIDKDSHVILGAQILGAGATEMISELTLAIAMGVRVEVLADMIHPHPTLSEIIMEACGDTISMAIHKA